MLCLQSSVTILILPYIEDAITHTSHIYDNDFYIYKIIWTYVEGAGTIFMNFLPRSSQNLINLRHLSDFCKFHEIHKFHQKWALARESNWECQTVFLRSKCVYEEKKKVFIIKAFEFIIIFCTQTVYML